MEHFLNMGAFGSVFAVPSAVVDNFIKLANEASIKVLLYLLRNSDTPQTEASIASALNITEGQVEEAFAFWENANIISGESKPSEVRVKPSEAEQTTSSVKPAVRKNVRPDTRSFSISPSEIAERVSGSEEIKCLFDTAEQTLGKPLTHTEQRTFLWMHDFLGLTTEVILMMTAYCCSIEKTGMSYISTVAYDWSEREINTLERAEQEIKEQGEKSSYNGKIMRIFCMDRRPTKKQQEYIDSWKARDYSLELIEYAYEKTIENKGKLNFSYINGILENWSTQGISTKAQADEESRARADGAEKTYSFNIDEYKALANNFGGE